ncbi:MAG TPA: efflux transporter outer membrane subunit, partial [Steroidobacteraceae bacterium]|nr:efflux transporter outer membrane subunit [Steroidobacteraceae bacterium]
APAARAALALLLALPGGCSLSPHYQRPTVPAPPETYKEAGDWQPASPADTTPRGHWWSMFGDPDLDALEAQVSDANQSLKAAFATLAQARAQTRIARSAWFPTITAQGDATRGETSVYQSTYTPGKDRNGNSFVVGGDLSYEVDLFGRIRDTVAGARASEQATAGDVATLDLELHAELATDYFTLRGLDVEQQLLDRTVGDYQHALQLTEYLYKGGAAAISDVQLAQSQLETARTQAEDTRLRRAQNEHAIAVLIGREASTFSLEARSGGAFHPMPGVAIGVPSQLLERRPDVAAAERRVAAANAGIGVARAAYFPVLDLLGSAGSASVATSQLFSAPAQYWSIGPQALLTVFDGGLHAAQSAQAHALYDQQVANYRGVVLTAFQDVEDNLVALRQLQRESVSEAAAVTATQGALDQANLRYKGGIVTYLEVVSTENAALAARLAAADIEIRRAAATVLLVKALGGDWNPPRQGS